MIFFSLSISLVNITLPIFVAIVSSPRWYHFAYPCDNYLLLYLIVFYLSWFLCFSLSQSPAQLSLSLHLLVIFLSFSICLVDTTSYILVTIVSASFISLRLSLLQLSSTCPDHLLLLCIIFSFYWLLWFYLLQLLMHLSSSLHPLMIFFSSYLRLVDITFPILVVTLFYFSWYSSPCHDYFASPCRNCRRVSPRQYRLVFPWFWCLGKSLPRHLGGRLDCVSHIGEQVIGEQANLG